MRALAPERGGTVPAVALIVFAVPWTRRARAPRDTSPPCEASRRLDARSHGRRAGAAAQGISATPWEPGGLDAVVCAPPPSTGTTALAAMGALKHAGQPAGAWVDLFDPTEGPFGATRRSISVGREPRLSAVTADGGALFFPDRVSNTATLLHVAGTTEAGGERDRAPGQQGGRDGGPRHADAERRALLGGDLARPADALRLARREGEAPEGERGGHHRG
jgi:hypothetical protein